MGDGDGDTHEEHQEESATGDLHQDSRPSSVDVDTSRDTSANSDPLEEVSGSVSSRDSSGACELSVNSPYLNQYDTEDRNTTSDSEQGDPFHMLGSSPDLATVLTSLGQTTKAEAVLMIMSFAARHHITGTALGNLLEMINTMFGHEVVPQTKYNFDKILSQL